MLEGLTPGSAMSPSHAGPGGPLLPFNPFGPGHPGGPSIPWNEMHSQ